MLDPKNGDHNLFIIDLVEDAIGATARRKQAGELAPQGMADTARVFAQWPKHELDHRGGDARRQPSKLSLS